LDATGFMPVFSLSCIVRALGLILFFALVREPDEAGGEIEMGQEEAQPA
jgi:hypothetical protein